MKRIFNKIAVKFFYFMAKQLPETISIEDDYKNNITKIEERISKLLYNINFKQTKIKWAEPFDGDYSSYSGYYRNREIKELKMAVDSLKQALDQHISVTNNRA